MRKSKLMMPFVLAFLLFFNISCISISYVHDLAIHQAKIIQKQQDIQNLLLDKQIESKTKFYLAQSKSVLMFCESIGLKTKGNYTKFVKLEQDSVSYVVSAAFKNRLEEHLWNYPIVGPLPYKGFPSKNNAIIEANALKKQGFDVYIRGVSAYSSLGWFNDPIFSSMLNLDFTDYVSTLIHEISHLNFFYKGQADYNEQIASIIGFEGAKLYFKSKGDNDHLQEVQDKWEDAILFASFISKEIESLKKWYQKQNKPSEQNRTKRFEEIQKRFDKTIKQRLKTNHYVDFSNIKLNNARILTFGTYLKDIKPIYENYKKRGIDLKTWIMELRARTK